MKVGIIGAGRHAAARRQAVAALPGVTVQGVLGAGPLGVFLERLDAAFVTVPTAEHFRIAEAATKRGVHVFLEWPPATSIRECQAIVGLSEEAGVEVGVSRPLRFQPVFETLPPAWRASLILLRRAIPASQEAAWPRWLAAAADLCCALAQSSSVQRIDAEAVRSSTAWPDAVAFALRFHSGTYAQVSLRRTTDEAAHTCYAAGGDFAVEATLEENENDPGAYASAVARETQAFVQALAGQQPAPVSILDGLHTMRLVERLMEKLR